jgi:hypothetical protein
MHAIAVVLYRDGSSYTGDGNDARNQLRGSNETDVTAIVFEGYMNDDKNNSIACVIYHAGMWRISATSSEFRTHFDSDTLDVALRIAHGWCIAD